MPNSFLKSLLYILTVCIWVFNSLLFLTNSTCTLGGWFFLAIYEICHVNNEQWKMTNDGRNRTTKPRKNRNARRKGNLRVVGDIRSGHHQTGRDNRKKFFKEYLRRASKILENKLYSRNLIKGINTLAVLLVRYSGPFLKWTGEDI